MTTPYTRAPHQGASGAFPAGGVNHAGLLIDFDNVTMGMRSDLSKELKHLLASDVIKGKVSVQRAYADWRRYPQYIVPLSEASIDLIFAPAYGSNKKNATDIRMAIDAMELIFTRPEIGTYILLTGDSDFSSLVLKLKEYGKYVIGVGIQESSSDILVQNCDEYYSYTSLTGLRKTTGTEQKPQDAWVLVTEALKRMQDREDVMRSDRLKQVMQEIDPNFDEGGLGFSKFSKFLTEAASRSLVDLKKLENGQYEVAPPRGGRGRKAGEDRGGRQSRSRSRRERHGASEPHAKEKEVAAETEAEPAAESAQESNDPLGDAYDLMTRAMEELREAGRSEVRDSDVKRKLLELDPSFDEAELGFSKFTKFLAQAADHDRVVLRRTDAGNYEVSLPNGRPRRESVAPREERKREEPVATVSDDDAAQPATDEGSRAGASVMEIHPDESESSSLRLGPRRGSTRRRGDEDLPSLFAGQVAGGSESVAVERRGPSVGVDQEELDASALGLPTDPDAIVRYLSHRYRGVGEKTAETLVERFGTNLFATLRDRPEAISEAITPKRAEQVLEAWKADYERRTARSGSRKS